MSMSYYQDVRLGWSLVFMTTEIERQAVTGDYWGHYIWLNEYYYPHVLAIEVALREDRPFSYCWAQDDMRERFYGNEEPSLKPEV